MVTFTQEVSSIGSAAHLIHQALRSYDIDPQPLFATAGIDPQHYADPNARILTTRLQKLWQLSVDKTGDESFGLVVAERMQPAALHGLGFAWLASDTLRDALTRLARFSRLINTLVDIRLEDKPGGTELCYHGPEKWPNFVSASGDAGLAVFLRMCRLTAASELRPLSVQMYRSRPQDSTPFERFFDAPIQYDAECYKLVFDTVLLDTTLPLANPELARLNDETVVKYLARFDRSDIVLQVRSRIIETLPAGLPQPGKIAESINVSLRNMQRKLKDENTNYRQLLEQTRKELALQYIKEHHHSISEITYMLGFTEPSNFTRAFRRWTGNSPTEYRSRASGEI